MVMWPFSTLTPSGKPPNGWNRSGYDSLPPRPRPGRDIQRHLVAAVRDAAAARPAVLVQHVQRAQVFDQAVAERAVELQPVAVGAHAAVADQVARILHREQVLAGRHRLVVVAAQGGLQLEVERVARLLVPEQIVLAQRLGVGDRRYRGRSGRWHPRTASGRPAAPP